MCCLASVVSCPLLGLRVSFLDPREKSWRREGLIESRSDLVLKMPVLNPQQRVQDWAASCSGWGGT